MVLGWTVKSGIIESQHTTRDEGTMTDQELEATNQEREAEPNNKEQNNRN